MTYVDRLLTTTPAVVDGHSRPSVAMPAEMRCPELAPLLSVLFLMIDETRSMVVNITSAHSGAGTSTVARKLAEAAAATGWCRVALLDARPNPDATGRGLVETVEQDESPVLTPSRVGALEIDTGRLCTGGRTLTRIESVRRLYGSLRDRYLLVVVDCPAVFAGQQTLMVAGAADDTVLVVEAERTALADVARARAALEQRGAGVLGMVMNKSRSRIPAMFGGSA
jgi:Mrp family chromosome partitioning ATPase